MAGSGSDNMDVAVFKAFTALAMAIFGVIFSATLRYDFGAHRKRPRRPIVPYR
jgi:hypothetical protein